MAEVDKAICGKLWDGNESWTEPCHLPAGHKPGCAYRTIKDVQEPDALDRLSNALAEATIALNTLKKGGRDCD